MHSTDYICKSCCFLTICSVQMMWSNDSQLILPRNPQPEVLFLGLPQMTSSLNWEYRPFLNNKCIRNSIHSTIVYKPATVLYWNSLFPGINWQSAWLLHIRYGKYLKILHRCHPVYSKLKSNLKYKLNIDPLCSFCNSIYDTITHLFWNCALSPLFF